MDGKTCEYYVAIAEFVSVEDSILAYNSCDGNGLEHSGMVFDLGFIPDGMIFKRKARTKARSLAGEPSACWKTKTRTKIKINRAGKIV